MLFNKVITLGKREVYADRKSVRQNEFYQAVAAGLRPEIMFVVRTTDYNEERTIIYNEKDYTVIRTYDRDDEMTELVCEVAIGTEV